MKTVQIKTAELTGLPLNLAVAKAAKIEIEKAIYRINGRQIYFLDGIEWNPSTNWSQGGPLIGEYTILFDTDDGSVIWAKTPGQLVWRGGSTHLVASCRAIVCSKLGPTVHVPADLVGEGV